MNHAAIEVLVAEVAARLIKRKATLASVESCTGGGVAFELTRRPGSSDWFKGGLVTYSNRAKIDLAGVPSSLLDEFGAVSEEVARAMAGGGARAFDCDFAVSITGIAGPDGGSEQKPLGTVCFGWSLGGGAVESTTCLIPGGRDQVREASIARSLEGLIARLE